MEAIYLPIRASDSQIKTRQLADTASSCESLIDL